MSDRVLYTMSEVAEVLGVHYETVARWVRTGKLRGVKLSRRKVVVPQEQLDALLAEGSSNFTAQKSSSLAGSPQRWLALVRTLTPQEAKKLRASIQDFEQVEEVD